MRKLVLIAICGTGVFCAPLPLIAQRGGGETPLIPVADMPNAGGGATAPSEPPLEVDAEEVPELIPPRQVGGGAEAPGQEPEPTRAPAPAPEPAPAPAPVEPAAEPTASVAMPQPAADAQAAQDDEPEEPVGEVPDDAPTAPEPDEDEQEEEFEEEFDDVPEPGEHDAPVVRPQAEAGPQLPRTGADLPALLLSGMALTVSGMSLRAVVRGRS